MDSSGISQEEDSEGGVSVSVVSRDLVGGDGEPARAEPSAPVDRPICSAKPQAMQKAIVETTQPLAEVVAQIASTNIHHTNESDDDDEEEEEDEEGMSTPPYPPASALPNTAAATHHNEAAPQARDPHLTVPSCAPTFPTPVNGTLPTLRYDSDYGNLSDDDSDDDSVSVDASEDGSGVVSLNSNSDSSASSYVPFDSSLLTIGPSLHNGDDEASGEADDGESTSEGAVEETLGNDGKSNSFPNGGVAAATRTTRGDVFGKKKKYRSPKFIPPKTSGEAYLNATNNTVSSSSSSSSINGYYFSTKAKAIKPSSTLYLPSLPSDTIHLLSTYLTPTDLVHLSGTSRRMQACFNEVWKKVRMHSVKCCGEVMMAWASGEHADARELAALYIKNGVPIYPAPMGHAYHTIVWRMGLEVKEMTGADGEEGENGEGISANNNATFVSAAQGPPTNDGKQKLTQLDPFYISHFNQNDMAWLNSNPSLSYVEEKSLFWKQKMGVPVESPPPSPDFGGRMRRRRHSLNANADALNANPDSIRENIARLIDDRSYPPNGGQRLRRSSFSGPSPNNMSPFSSRLSSPSLLKSKSPIKEEPKMTLRIHRHLADQHLFGLPAVNDENGGINSGRMNLNADFYHPHWEKRLSFRHHWMMGGSEESAIPSSGGVAMVAPEESLLRLDTLDSAGSAATVNGEVVAPWGEITRAHNTEVDIDETMYNPTADSPYRAAAYTMVNSVRPNSARRSTMQHVDPLVLDYSSVLNPSPASDVHMDIYSSSAASLKSDTEDGTSKEVAKVLVRCAHYQRKLEAFLASFDSHGYEECLLDLWDLMFPNSVGIHYYNRQSPVPRMSKLQTFLTTPCPKAIGIVQCEIERIKVSSKNKGPNVKGRFFPSYEYRLFIRDTKNDNPHNLPRVPPRKDSVLLVAKNKNRKGKNDSAGMEITTPTSPKRGVSNYYMCLPQQRDVDTHFKSANKTTLAPGEKSGLTVAPLAAQSNYLGRLQSNFIGTEFQIFSPPATKQPARRNGSFSDNASLSSSGSVDGKQRLAISSRRASADGAAPSVTRQNRRGSGLVRFARRASLTMTRRGSLNRNSASGEPVEEDEERSQKKPPRRLSWGSAVPGSAKKAKRKKRRAIANSEPDAAQFSHAYPVVNEEEVGAVTYTANLLGNRPRVMDVCIPKLLEDGSVSNEWRRVPDDSVEDADTSTSNRMLNKFKTIQRVENAGDENASNGEGNNNINTADHHGLMILQNRPPWWNIELGAFVLNFGGRVSVASVKNFQLCEPANQDCIMLQFGRIQGRHSFTMDFQHPLTPMQAFSIAISSLQSKISFG